MSDLEPDVDDIVQEEPTAQALTPIPVVIEGPARVVELPGVNLVADQMDLDNVTAVRLFGRDQKRKRLILIPSTGALRLATAQAQCKAGSGAVIPVGVSVTITTYTELWVMAASGAGCTVSYLSEQWAT